MARAAASAAIRDGRRDAFIDAAHRLIATKGYVQTSVQDVLDELDASRGAFYHYFDSKAVLLDAVVERMVDVAIADVLPVVEAPGLDALARLQALFGGIARWKGERTELLQVVMASWQDDDNALTRDKFRQGLVSRLVPLLARIIEQGEAEGTFNAGDPAAAARVLVSLLQGANDAATQLYFARQTGTVTFEEVERTLAAYGHAYERILGIPDGSLPLGDPETLRLWFDSPTPARTRGTP
jgi:AcrR family transcriptional regulator